MATAAAGVALAALAGMIPAVSVMGHRLSDAVVRYSSSGKPKLQRADVLVIAIDDASRRSISEPLAYWQPAVAKAIRALAEARPRAIGIDLIFSAGDARALSESRELAQAAAESASRGVPVIFGYARLLPMPQTPPYLLAATSSPRSLGYLDLPADEDDAVRRFEPCHSDPPDVAYSLGTRLALSGRREEARCDRGLFSTPTLTIRMDDRRSLPIPFGQAPQPERLAFATLLQMADAGREDEVRALAANKMVLIGSYELQDRFVTPTDAAGERTAGVDIHAVIAQSLYTGQVLAQLPPWMVWAFATVLALGASAIALSARLRVSLVALLAIALLGTAAVITARGYGLVLPAVPLLGSVILAAMVSFARRYQVERGMHRELREQFSRFVSPEVVDQIVRDGVEMGGTRRFVTVLFADVRGFTTMAERMSPEVLVVQLNEYLEAMTEVIVAEGGYLDKFIGDGILAVFGAPVAQRDAAWHAVRAAHAMLERLAGLNAVWKEQRRNEWSIGIGIHSGDAVVGNIGSWRKLDYTVVGDVVNTASRIESLTKTSIQRYNAHILLSGATVEELERWDHYCDVFAMEIEQLKGKEQLTQLFVLRGLVGAGRQGGSAHA